MRSLASLLRLAGQSLLFDWRLTLCQFFGLIAVLVPLLLVMGLKHGAIQGLVDKLNAAMATADASDYAGLQKLHDDVRAREAEIESLEERWLELSEQLG